MSRSRGADAALAALATVAVTLPLTDLFTPTSAWVRPSLVLVIVVALAGVGLRALTTVRPLVVAGQAVVLAEGVALIHGGGHLWAGVVPTPETARALGVLLGDAYATVTQFSAPAPADRGTTLAISLLVAATALATDAIAVTYRSPALAGIPLLAAFLAAATNTYTGLAAWLVVPPAVVWLAMVGRQGVRSLRTWGGTAAPGGRPAADPSAAFAGLGRVVGGTALAAAVVLPGIVPHLSPTFIADGLARGDGGGGGGGTVRLSTSIDIARDLADRSSDPVLVYRTTSKDPEPLRVGLLDSYRRGRWQASSDISFVPLDGRLPGASALPSVKRTTEKITVSSSSIGVPQVAMPANPLGAPFPVNSWQVTGDGLVELTQPVGEYTVEYEQLAPTADQFGATPEGNAPNPEDLALEPRSEERVRTLLDEITDDGDTPLETAVAIQDYLRSPTFTYSEDLADQTAQGARREEPLVSFLDNRRGYCVQFSSAMIMLARAGGIPARMAVGFLPGAIDGDDRVVRVSDAHAWPELWFPDLGWMRFEPTPGVRSGVAPGYTREASSPGSSAAPSASASTSPSASAAPRPTGDVTAEDPTDPGSTTTDTGVLDVVRDNATSIGVGLLVLLVLALTPVGAWLARRRARARARDDAERTEAEWQSLLSRLGDIGLVPHDGATPRRASQELGRAAYLTPDEDAALGRVVATLERARYARPGTELPDVQDDVRTVWRAALGRRQRLDRVRALLLPEEGRRHWLSMLRLPARFRRGGAPAPDDED
ncbi:transglutaminase TgpA family protein [Phycicoccus avicenniae]|uniref:transglutaminase TgpA family protein n=1 Tax=Phycicoccus avicenniae TaxID=2828860 RepID=UPI003D2A1FFC